MIQCRHAESVDWLIEILIDSLVEGSVPENVGAAAVLAYIIPDDHPRLAVVRDFLSAAPIEFTAAVCRAMTLRHARAATSRRWFVEHLARVLLDPALLTASGRALGSIVGHLSSQPDAVEMASAVPMNARERALFEWLITGVADMSAPVDLGGVVLRNSRPIFSRPTPPGIIGRSITTKPAPDTLFDLINVITLFVVKKGAPQLRNLAQLLSKCTPEFLRGLPLHIRTEIPVPIDSDMCAQLEEMSAATVDDVRTIIRHRRFRGKHIRHERLDILHFDLALLANFELPRWQSLIRHDLQVAVFTWAHAEEHEVRAPEFTEPLMRALLATPAVLLQWPALWGVLAQVCPHHESKMRETLRAHAANEVRAGGSYALSPFRLQFPDDAGLLPHLATEITLHALRLGSLASGPDIVQRAVGSLAPLNDLRAVCDDLAVPRRDRIAACVLTWLHSDSDGLHESCNLHDLYSDEDAYWSVRALTDCLLLLGAPADPRSRFLANQLIDCVRANLRERDRIDPLLALWREVSAAPVSTKGVGPLWLGL
jgi:hypothetical protein